MVEAAQSGQPIILYFYAAWCPPCYKLKEKTFSNPEVIQNTLAYARIKVDMSFIHSEKIQKIAHEFRIGGYPSLLFFDPEGNEIVQVRRQGFISAGEMLAILRTIRANFSFAQPPEPTTEV